LSLQQVPIWIVPAHNSPKAGPGCEKLRPALIYSCCFGAVQLQTHMFLILGSVDGDKLQAQRNAVNANVPKRF